VPFGCFGVIFTLSGEPFHVCDVQGSSSHGDAAGSTVTGTSEDADDSFTQDHIH